MSTPANTSVSSQRVLGTWSWRLKYLAIFVVAVAFYSLTRPLNHSESYDSINYALFAENFPLGTAPDSRNILFPIVNRLMFVVSQGLGFDIRAIDLIAGICVMASSLSLVLFARVMQNGFGVSSFAAWAGAAFMGVSYGFWRYSGGAEVYSPSIFLILCSLTLVFRFLKSDDQNDKDNDDHREENSNDDENKTSWLSLYAAGVVAGIAILFYQPNVIPLFVVGVLFCFPFRFKALLLYPATVALVVMLGLVASYIGIHDDMPSADGLVEYATARNIEFREPQPVHIAAVKMVLAFGHDVFSAHWTRTLDPVRSVVDPLIPGCVYNFNVVVFAGKGIQSLTVIAMVLFIPILFLLGRLHWMAARHWTLARPNTPTLFLFCWWASMTLVLGILDPGSFEAWIPVLLPFTALLTVFVFEPCCKQNKQKSLVVFLVLMMSYNFFGGLMIWRNNQGDYFYHKTAWARQHLTEEDTVLLNEFDYRLVDYLSYYGDAKVVHLTGADSVTIARSTPQIQVMPLEEFFTTFEHTTNKLFVFDDVLSPGSQIKECRNGLVKYESAVKLAERLKEKVILVNEGRFGKTYQVRQRLKDDEQSGPSAGQPCAQPEGSKK